MNAYLFLISKWKFSETRRLQVTQKHRIYRSYREIKLVPIDKQAKVSPSNLERPKESLPLAPTKNMKAGKNQWKKMSSLNISLGT